MPELPDTTGWPSPTRLFKFFGLYGDRRPDEAAMRRGRLVDAASNLMATGHDLRDFRSENGEIWQAAHPELSPYLLAMQKFLDEHTIIVVRHQVDVVNEYPKYRGRFDWEAVIDGLPAYVDLKTTSSGRIPKCTAVQTAMYAQADGDRRKKRFGLALCGNANYRLIPFTDYRDFDQGNIWCMAWWGAETYRLKTV